MKSYFEERGGTYTQIVGFMIIELLMEEQPNGWIGKYGFMRQEYLKKWKKGMHTQLIMSGNPFEKLSLNCKKKHDTIYFNISNEQYR